MAKREAVTDPFLAGGRGQASPRNPEAAPLDSVPALDEFAVRLRRAGASPEEIDAVQAFWNDPGTDGWDDGRKREVLAWTDAQIVAEVKAIRAEAVEMGLQAPQEAPAGPEGTDTAPGEDSAADAHPRLAAEARELIEDGAPIKDIARWVGQNKDRARVVLQIEGEVRAPRVTLVSAMESVIEGS